VWVLGGAPKDVEQAQKILVLVFSWAWTSSPMTGSKFMSISVIFVWEAGVQPPRYRVFSETTLAKSGP
jgi:hypothetical protein